MRTLSFMSALMFCVMVLLCSGCGPQSSAIDPELSDAGPPVILHLETRDAIVTVMASPEGRLYTIRTRGGRVLAEHLSERQLQARAPEIHHLIKKSYTEDGPTAIWAGMLEHDRLE